MIICYVIYDLFSILKRVLKSTVLVDFSPLSRLFSQPLSPPAIRSGPAPSILHHAARKPQAPLVTAPLVLPFFIPLLFAPNTSRPQFCSKEMFYMPVASSFYCRLVKLLWHFCSVSDFVNNRRERETLNEKWAGTKVHCSYPKQKVWILYKRINTREYLKGEKYKVRYKTAE